MMEIRSATPKDAVALTRIALAAKGYWGYPERWMERWREGLTIVPEFVRDNEAYMVVSEGTPVGFYALVEWGRGLDLEHLWVSPTWIGRGVGRTLFEHVLARAAELGAASVEIEADPNAEGFYRRMGARAIGERVYDLDGQRRTLPLLAVDVPSHNSAV